MEKIEYKPEGIELEKIKFEFPKSVIERYTNAEHEWRSMLAFIRENSNDCSIKHTRVPDNLRIRYSLSQEWAQVGLAWYLLDEYFKGNITIKENVQPE
jgi:hypothetical protein